MNRPSRSDVLQAWLESQGFPTEMRVGGLLVEKGFFTEHAVLYDDPLEAKVREIDLVARAWAVADETAPLDTVPPDVELILVIECKSNVDAWIGFTSLAAPPAKSELCAFRSELLDPLLTGAHQAEALFTCLGKSDILDPDIVAHAMVSFDSRTVGKPRQDERNVAHFGLVSAFNATLALEAKIIRERLSSAQETVSAVPIFLPILVIDGELWEYRLRGGREFSLEESRWLPTRVNHGIWTGGVFQEMTITVVPEKHLPAYLDAARGDLECLTKAIAPVSADLWRIARQRLTQRGSRRGPFPRIQR